jgi:hypothetical protein
MMALSAGALMVEKHVPGDLDWIHFDGVALTCLAINLGLCS